MGNALIFSGANVKALKSNIDINGSSQILSGTVDPTSVATSAPIGSLYTNTSTGVVYRKLDAGSSTNWVNTNGAVTPTLNTTSKNADYTATTSDNFIAYDVSGATRTLTLFSPSGNAGAVLKVKLTNQASTNILNITDGSFSTTLATIDEEVTLYSNGTNWKALNRYIPKTIATTTTTVTGTTVNPTKGTVVYDVFTWWREDNYMVGTIDYKQTTGGAIGGVVYKIAIPGGWSANTTNMVTGSGGNPTRVGFVVFFGTTTTKQEGEVAIFDSTNLMFRQQLDVNSRRNWGSASNSTYDLANTAFSATVRIPIANWSA